jgi:6-phosphogluconolactonase
MTNKSSETSFVTSQKKLYALVGNFGFAPGPKGLSVYSYDPATANMEPIESAFDYVNVGHQSVDAERNIVYVINECPSLRGQTGGGGYLMAVKIDPESGKLRLINEKKTLSADPCYTCLDKSKRYIIVSHHVDFGFVSKIVKSENGYSSVTVCDDAALVLFRINEDGSLGDVCDISLTPGESVSGPHTISRHHSVIADPSGELFVVCDKGLDRIHTYRLDRLNGKLMQLQETIVETGFIPRYSVFHPTLPILYANYEKKSVVHAFLYDVANGKLDRVGSAPLMLDKKAAEGLGKVEAADILIHPSGQCLYVSIRGVNTIAVLDVDDAGVVSLRENIDCGGGNPRGLCISPDARFLFAANMDSGTIAAFSISADGALRATGTGAKARCPGNMKIIAL